MIKKPTEKRSVSGARLNYKEWVRMTDRDKELSKGKKRKREDDTTNDIDDPMLYSQTMIASGIVRNGDGEYVDPQNTNDPAPEPYRTCPCTRHDFAKFTDPSTNPPAAQRARPFSIVVCDEVKSFPTASPSTARCASRSSRPAGTVSALTGTPVGTRPKQMAHIFDLLDCLKLAQATVRLARQRARRFSHRSLDRHQRPRKLH